MSKSTVVIFDFAKAIDEKWWREGVGFQALLPSILHYQD
jgi:hypothetical protein